MTAARVTRESAVLRAGRSEGTSAPTEVDLVRRPDVGAGKTGDLFGAAGLWSATRIATLVRIDARDAEIVRWEEGRISIERIASDVPSHRKSVCRIRHGPGVRHGGGYAQTTIESDRLEHLARFLDRVAAMLPSEGPIEIIGHGPVPVHLAAQVRADDARQRRAERITCTPTPLLTEPQLVARLRDLVGAPAPRRRVGPEH